MKLDVPLVLQEKDSNDCGLAGICMILEYYNLKYSIEDLKTHLTVDETGTYAPQIGSFLIEKGFGVEIVTLNPRIFTNNDKELGQSAIIDKFKKMLNESKSQQDKKILDYYIEFLNEGGKLKVKIPDAKDVLEEIKNKRPLGALLTTNFLSNSKPCLNFHFNVITGIDDKFVYVNDPLPDFRGGEKKYLIEDFFFGLHASCYGDIDNGSLIKVKKIY